MRTDGSEQWLPAKVEGIKVKAGDLLYFNTWGGGGWGDPFKRDPELVRLDVERRLVSREGAQRYGVVIGDDGAVDGKATADLRARLVAARGGYRPVQLRRRGGRYPRPLRSGDPPAGAGQATFIAAAAK